MIATNRDIFFKSYTSQFNSNLKQEQIDGLNSILDAFASDPLLESLQQAAYMLATTWHETGQTFQPICERGNKDYFRKYNGKLGNQQPEDGYLYRGRGYVQLTFKDNYKKASEKLNRLTARYPQGVDLVTCPDDTLKPQIAADILLIGMREGWFTGKKLSDYIKTEKCDYYNARRIINALDRADKLAEAAKKFETVLQQALTSTTASSSSSSHTRAEKPEDHSELWDAAYGKEQK